jgi:hypothetical protein
MSSLGVLSGQPEVGKIVLRHSASARMLATASGLILTLQGLASVAEVKVELAS